MSSLKVAVNKSPTPVAALRSFAVNPEKFLGLFQSAGTVAISRPHLLMHNTANRNPLSDIANTRKIAAVVLSGRLIAKPELQKMLADVEAAATNKK